MNAAYPQTNPMARVMSLNNFRLLFGIVAGFAIPAETSIMPGAERGNGQI